MPELPEVETLVRALSKKIIGKKIKNVTVRWPKMVKPLSVAEFEKKVRGKTIKKVTRRAKMIVFDLSDKSHILVHLKMTGQLILISKFKIQNSKLIVGGHPQKGGQQDLPKNFTHVWLTFTDGSVLYFNDLRKFGWMRYVTSEKLIEILNDIGIEPLGKEFTKENLQKIIGRYRKRNIKQILTDQSLIAGVGNIYADESCFCAHILPTRRAETLTPKEISLLHLCIPKVLKLAISKKGTTFKDYVQLDGKEGRMVRWLKVYNKTKQPCSVCGTIIKKITLNGRGTHFCENCQK